jgi:hypothetical protein
VQEKNNNINYQSLKNSDNVSRFDSNGKTNEGAKNRKIPL